MRIEYDREVESGPDFPISGGVAPDAPGQSRTGRQRCLIFYYSGRGPSPSLVVGSPIVEEIQRPGVRKDDGRLPGL
ncbi:hypothetical protein CRG98_031437 [Punica granatum]|uniref:Uncharacterized protein n=1 Tax=Punica granatum TaxID=22663 RepID=A0A2I0IVY9_PUNGR|nr:hypothetical protein CRG98_031437 [Punica granatum]